MKGERLTRSEDRERASLTFLAFVLKVAETHGFSINEHRFSGTEAKAALV